MNLILQTVTIFDPYVTIGLDEPTFVLGESAVYFHFILINENHVSKQKRPRWEALLLKKADGWMLSICRFS